MKGLQQELDQWDADKKEKRTMSVSTLQFSIQYNEEIFTLTITPKGKGFYDIKCVITTNQDVFYQKTLTLKDYFSHSMSMSRAKDLVLLFDKHVTK